MPGFTTCMSAYLVSPGANTSSPLWKIIENGTVWPAGWDVNDPDCAFTVDLDKGTIFSPSRGAYLGAGDCGLLQTVSDDKALFFSTVWTPANALSFQATAYGDDYFVRYAMPGPYLQPCGGITITRVTGGADYFCFFPCHNLRTAAFPPAPKG